MRNLFFALLFAYAFVIGLAFAVLVVGAFATPVAAQTAVSARSCDALATDAHTHLQAADSNATGLVALEKIDAYVGVGCSGQELFALMMPELAPQELPRILCGKFRQLGGRLEGQTSADPEEQARLNIVNDLVGKVTNLPVCQ